MSDSGSSDAKLPASAGLPGSAGLPAAVDPAEALLRALSARSAQEKENIARSALAEPIDDEELEALLWRQVYLGRALENDWTAALAVAEKIVAGEVLGDLGRQDAARAASALGAYDAAVGHLRIAARIAPPERRAFHYSTLGALLRFSGKPEASVDSYETALRWAGQHRPLYLAQLELARRAAGDIPQVPVADLRQKLEEQPERLGYEDWVLGELALLAGDSFAARAYLKSFIERVAEGNALKVATLRLELLHAQRLLTKTETKPASGA